MRIVNAAGMAKTGLPLVIAGRNGWLYDRVNERIKQIQKDNPKAIRRYFYLPRTLLMYLLKGAKALIFPSLYEGFGLPVLEAMIMGVPVITSHTSYLPEIGGEAPLYVNPYKTTEIAEAMEKIADDPDLCSAMIKKGGIQAERFTPDKHVNALKEGYSKAQKMYYQ